MLILKGIKLDNWREISEKLFSKKINKIKKISHATYDFLTRNRWEVDFLESKKIQEGE